MLNLLETKLCSKTLLLVLACLGAVGCRSTSDNQIDLLERELRTQEDYIYELEDYVVEYSEKLRDSRCSTYPQQAVVYTEQLGDSQPAPAYSSKKRSKKKTRRSSAKESSVVEKTEDNLPTPEQDEPKTPQHTPESSPEEIAPEDLEVPDLDFEIGDPVTELENVNPLRQAASTKVETRRTPRGVLRIPDPVNFEPEVLETVLMSEDLGDQEFVEEMFDDDPLELTDRVAERVEITQIFSDGDVSGSPQSLLAVVEALDANNEPVDLDGEVSLMVMTGDRESPERLKRWNFDAEETMAAWQSSDLGDGLHLELPLEELELPQGDVELWVRLVTTDGRKLLAQLPFEPTQLTSISSYEEAYEVPRVPTTGLVLVEEVETEAIEHPRNELHVRREAPSLEKVVEVAEVPKVKSQPRWRASMQRTGQRTGRGSDGFATTSSKAKRWIAQPLGRRQAYVPAAKVTSHQTPVVQPKPPVTKRSPATWTSSSRY